MSKYTYELKEIIDSFGRAEIESWFEDYDLNKYLREDEIESIRNANIWSKEELSRKIVDHYYYREICTDDINRFIHYCKLKMQEIMERKLPLIYSSSIKYDPMVNVDFTQTTIRNTEGSSTGSTSGLGVNSDTPQGQISKTEVLQGKWASNVSGTEGVSNSADTGHEDITMHTKGNSGVSATAQAMVKQYRENIMAIDEEIIKEIGELFISLF